MTRTQELMLLIEAHNPATSAELMTALGWNACRFDRALKRLLRFGVVRGCHRPGCGYRCYRPSGESFNTANANRMHLVPSFAQQLEWMP